MQRLEKVEAFIEHFGLSEKSVLDELILWLSEDEINAFLDDFRCGWDLNIDVDGKEVPAPSFMY